MSADAPRRPIAGDVREHVLRGRDAEAERLSALVAAADGGHGAALVLHGEAGIGKTSLLASVRRRHGGVTLCASATEAESRLPFAVLHALLEPLLPESEALPAPQRAALLGALALGPPEHGDRFAVCLATLSLLRAAAERASVLVAIDDVQWADRASAECLLFAARRLDGTRIAMVLARRDGERAPAGIDALPALRVDPVARAAARAIVADTGLGLVTAPCDAVLDAAAGNPLALRELAASLTVEERAGHRPLPAPLRPAGRLASVLARRIERLPQGARAAMVVAAAGDGANLAEIRAACGRLGIAADALAPAQDAGLVTLGDGRVAFSHPLVRSAAYHLVARPSERRSAHHALAECSAPDRAAWHLADASDGPDDAVARALHDAALRAVERRGYVEAAAAYERAAALSMTPRTHARRLLRASAARVSAGQLEQALACIEEASRLDAEVASDLRAQHTRAILLVGLARPGEALRIMDGVASAPLVVATPAVAATVGADAALAAMIDGRYREALERAERAASLLEPGSAPLVRAQVLTCLAASRVYRGDAASARALQEEVAPLLDALDPLDWNVGMRTHTLAIDVWLGLDEPRRARTLAERILAHVGEAAAWTARANPLSFAVRAAFDAGDWDEAARLADETVLVAEESGSTDALQRGLHARARLAAARGDEVLARADLDRAGTLVAQAAPGTAEVSQRAAEGFLALCFGRARAAVEVLAPLPTRIADEIGLVHATVIPWRPDLVEACVLVGRVDEARTVAAGLAEEAERSDRDAARALAARCAGLVAADGGERELEAALALHGTSAWPFDRARTLLVLGERLHRARRRSRARRVLEEAQAIFAALGAEPWRARTETLLGAASPARRAGGTSDDALTAQERRVAAVVATGRTVREAALELRVSPKTVDSHLRQVYAKLGIRSRAELALLAAERGWLDPVRKTDG
ncbi:MAG: AAA family ATPase [Candidatus Binatia bacterium]